MCSQVSSRENGKGLALDSFLCPGSSHCLSVNSQAEGSPSLSSVGLPGGIWMIWPTEPNGRVIVLLLNLRIPVEGPEKMAQWLRAPAAFAKNWFDTQHPWGDLQSSVTVPVDLIPASERHAHWACMGCTHIACRQNSHTRQIDESLKIK